MAGRRANRDQLHSIPEAGLGPAMRALPLADREFVRLYVDTGNAELAQVEYSGSKAGNGAAVKGSRRRWRPDVAAAVIEESRRRLSFGLPGHIALMEGLARGDGGVDEEGKRLHVPASVRFKATDNLLTLGGLRPKIEVEHHHEHVMTVSEQFAELIRLGRRPEEILANASADEREEILELVRQKDGGYGGS